MNPKYILGAILLSASLSLPAQEPFHNPDLPVEQRVTDLLSRLTLEEKVNLMKHDAAAVPRLGIPAYNWWNEALHGVARTPEKVTVFPQAIAMAATFDPEGLQRVGDIARAVQRGSCRRKRHPAVPRTHLLDTQHQHIPRPALGTRTGNLR